MSQYKYSWYDIIYANGMQGEVIQPNIDIHGELVSVDVRFPGGLRNTFALHEVHTLSVEERLRRIEERLGLG